VKRVPDPRRRHTFDMPKVSIPGTCVQYPPTPQLAQLAPAETARPVRAAHGTGCAAADCFCFATGTGRARTGGGQEAGAPKKAATASLPVAVGHEAARCRPWHLVVVDGRCQRRKPVRWGDGRQRQQHSRSPPRWHCGKIEKCNKCMRSAPY